MMETLQKHSGDIDQLQIKSEETDIRVLENSGNLEILEQQNELRAKEIDELQNKSDETNKKVLDNDIKIETVTIEIAQLQINSNDVNRILKEHSGNLDILEEENKLRANEIGQLQNKSTETNKRVLENDVKIQNNTNEIYQLQKNSSEIKGILKEHSGTLDILVQENEIRINEIGQLQLNSTETDKKVSENDIKIQDNTKEISHLQIITTENSGNISNLKNLVSQNGINIQNNINAISNINANIVRIEQKLVSKI